MLRQARLVVVRDVPDGMRPDRQLGDEKNDNEK